MESSNYNNDTMNQIIQYNNLLIQQQNLIANYAQIKTKYKKVEIMNLCSYNDMNKIKAAFNSTRNANNKNFDYEKIKNGIFFIIRSSCDDDIHKAIKYGIWSSSYKNNKILNDTFNSTKVPIYLFYTVVGSNQFSGVAEMLSPVDYNTTFPYWWDDLKWNGFFNIDWIYIKDVHYDDCKIIKQQFNNELRSITQLKDATELTKENAKELLKLFKYHDIGTSIFEAFSFMDGREEKLRLDRDQKILLVQNFKDSNPQLFENTDRKKNKSFNKKKEYNNYKSNNNNNYKRNYNKKNYRMQKEEVEYTPKVE